MAVGAINVLVVAFLLFMCVIQFKSTPAGIMEYLVLLGVFRTNIYTQIRIYSLVLLINMNFICKHNKISRRQSTMMTAAAHSVVGFASLSFSVSLSLSRQFERTSNFIANRFAQNCT